ncbi:hypothetical protein MXB_4702 [Myxobolus squamalis]|nr:hypothetical protein MXB_4702 [Myxobolus squamalis]
MKLSEIQYNAISSFYSIPNIIVVIICGVVVDKVGHRIGSEALQISAIKYLILWFGGFSLNLSVGIRLAFMQLLYFVNMKYSDSLYHLMLKKFNTFPPLTASAAVLSIGVFICFIDVWLCCILWIVDKKYNLNSTKARKTLILDENSQSQPIGTIHKVSNFAKIKSMSPTFWILVVFCFIFYQPFSSYNSISP